jgi:tRNA threonylcarbamoyladenosine biosynthesis protein TsaB
MPSAINMIGYSIEQYNKKQFEDVAYFEPFYLKEFFTGAK